MAGDRYLLEHNNLLLEDGSGGYQTEDGLGVLSPEHTRIGLEDGTGAILSEDASQAFMLEQSASANDPTDAILLEDGTSYLILDAPLVAVDTDLFSVQDDAFAELAFRLTEFAAVNADAGVSEGAGSGESASIVAPVQASEALAVAESASAQQSGGALSATSSDTLTVAESATAVADSANGESSSTSEAASLVVVASASESGSGTESNISTAAVSASDTGSLGEAESATQQAAGQITDAETLLFGEQELAEQFGGAPLPNSGGGVTPWTVHEDSPDWFIGRRGIYQTDEAVLAEAAQASLQESFRSTSPAWVAEDEEELLILASYVG